MNTDYLENKVLRSADQEAFGRQGYLLLPGLLEPALADFLWSYVHTKFACRLLSLGGDEQVPNTPSAYGDPAFDGLLEYLRPRIEEASGLSPFADLFLFPAVQARRYAEAPSRPGGMRSQRQLEYRPGAIRCMAVLC